MFSAILKSSRRLPGRNFTLSASNDIEWDEIIQRKHIKTKEFYENEALKRNYFYHIDLQGRLFLEDILPKNIATSLKSDKFLKFFYANINVNRTGSFGEYKYISKCGKEMNFIRPADTPIVFTNLEESEEQLLIHSGESRSTRFIKESLVMCEKTFRLYHPLGKHKHLPSDFLTLISSNVAVRLSAQFVEENDNVYFLCPTTNVKSQVKTVDTEKT